MSNEQTSLDGERILSTRPAHQQAGLKVLLEARGAQVLSFPSIEIAEIEPTPFHSSLVGNIEHYHIALFVSRNAVEGAFRFLNAEALPSDLQLGVIGEGSYQTLAQNVKELDSRIIRNQPPYHSEALLEAEQLRQVSDKNILIFRGQQGRTLLGDELRQRGATVNYCEVYHRRIPQYDNACFDKLCEAGLPTLVVLTSSEGMHNLISLVDAPTQTRLLRTPWLLISERMRETALDLGHNASITIASTASDEGIQQSICDWAQRKNSNL